MKDMIILKDEHNRDVIINRSAIAYISVCPYEKRTEVWVYKDRCEQRIVVKTPISEIEALLQN